MKGNAKWRVVLMLLACFSTTLRADIDDSAYEVQRSIKSAAERMHLERELRQQQQAAAERAEAERQENIRLAAERQAALAARPYPVRLTEGRCTKCHAETHYRQQAHTWPGWLLVVLRMKLLNGASIENSELVTIVTYLAAEHPADGPEVVLEYASLPAAAGLAGGAIWFVRQRRRKKK